MENIEIFLETVNQFSKMKLKRKKDIIFLLGEISRSSDPNMLESISFSAKYIMGLLRVMENAKNISGISNLNDIKNDLAFNIESLNARIKKLISRADSEKQKVFDLTYLQTNKESFGNFRELLSDLEWIKIYLNEQKRSAAKNDD